MLGLLPIFLVGFIFFLYSIDSLHIVYEGHLGMYSIGGALINTGKESDFLVNLSELTWNSFNASFNHKVSPCLNYASN